MGSQRRGGTPNALIAKPRPGEHDAGPHFRLQLAQGGSHTPERDHQRFPMRRALCITSPLAGDAASKGPGKRKKACHSMRSIDAAQLAPRIVDMKARGRLGICHDRFDFPIGLAFGDEHQCVSFRPLSRETHTQHPECRTQGVVQR